MAAAVVLGAALEQTCCPCAGLFGVPCPACGLTRAAWLLARGDLPGALRLHPFAPLLLPVLAATCAGVVWGRFRRRPALPVGASALVQGLAGLLLLLVLGVWLARFWGAWGGPVPVARWFAG
jgi:hypothetical protein